MAASNHKHKRNVDPEIAHRRAVKAARARTTVNYHVTKLVERADELTGEHIDQLRPLVEVVR